MTVGREEVVWTVIRAIQGFYMLGVFILWPARKASALREGNSNPIGISETDMTCQP